MRKSSLECRANLDTPVLMVGRSAQASVRLPAGCGFSATSCPDERNALTILRQGRHQAILCDLRTTGTGGKGLLNDVRAEFPDIAVVVVTTPRKLRHGILAMMAGASGYVQTPLLPENLTASLSGALKRKHLDMATRG